MSLIAFQRYKAKPVAENEVTPDLRICHVTKFTPSRDRLLSVGYSELQNALLQEQTVLLLSCLHERFQVNSQHSRDREGQWQRSTTFLLQVLLGKGEGDPHCFTNSELKGDCPLLSRISKSCPTHCTLWVWAPIAKLSGKSFPKPNKENNLTFHKTLVANPPSNKLLFWN